MCEFGNKNVFFILWHFFVEFFRFFNFQHLQKMRIFIIPKIVSATIFGLIIHIIKLIQTVQIQKLGLKFIS